MQVGTKARAKQIIGQKKKRTKNKFLKNKIKKKEKEEEETS